MERAKVQLLNQFLNYSVISGFMALLIEAFVLLFKTETVERVLLNERKKLLLDVSRIAIITLGISLILFGFMKKDPSLGTLGMFIVSYVISLPLGIELYFLGTWLLKDFGFGKNHFVIDEKHGKLYLIKNSNSKYILLADKPRVKNSEFVLLEGEAFIQGKKIYAESKRVAQSLPINDSNVPKDEKVLES